MATLPAGTELPKTKTPWEELDSVDDQRMAAIFRTVPELAHLKEPRLQTENGIRIALLRGSTDPKAFPDFTFTHRPLRWAPVPGLDIWAFVGSSGADRFVVVLYAYDDGKRFKHAASMTFKDTDPAVMLVAEKGHREELWWAFCWGCRESGTIKLDDQGRVMLTHRW